MTSSAPSAPDQPQRHRPDDGSRAPARSFALTFDSAACLPVLRRILRLMLAGSDPARVADAELVCTELVTNALDHATAPRTARLVVDQAENLRIAVVDGSPDQAVTLGASRLGSHRGLGMLLVDSIAAHWHVTRNAATKAVRATLTDMAGATASG